jgi:nicotinamidase-related amidase
VIHFTCSSNFQQFSYTEEIQLVIMSTPLDPKKTTLLLLDLQNGFLQRLPPDTSASVVDNAASAIAFARKNDIKLSYIRAALDESEVEAIPDRK